MRKIINFLSVVVTSLSWLFLVVPKASADTPYGNHVFPPAPSPNPITFINDFFTGIATGKNPLGLFMIGLGIVVILTVLVSLFVIRAIRRKKNVINSN